MNKKLLSWYSVLVGVILIFLTIWAGFSLDYDSSANSRKVDSLIKQITQSFEQMYDPANPSITPEFSKKMQSYVDNDLVDVISLHTGKGGVDYYISRMNKVIIPSLENKNSTSLYIKKSFLQREKTNPVILSDHSLAEIDVVYRCLTRSNFYHVIFWFVLVDAVLFLVTFCLWFMDRANERKKVRGEFGSLSLDNSEANDHMLDNELGDDEEEIVFDDPKPFGQDDETDDFFFDDFVDSDDSKLPGSSALDKQWQETLAEDKDSTTSATSNDSTSPSTRADLSSNDNSASTHPETLSDDAKAVAPSGVENFSLDDLVPEDMETASYDDLSEIKINEKDLFAKDDDTKENLVVEAPIQDDEPFTLDDPITESDAPVNIDSVTHNTHDEAEKEELASAAKDDDYVSPPQLLESDDSVSKPSAQETSKPIDKNLVFSEALLETHLQKHLDESNEKGDNVAVVVMKSAQLKNHATLQKITLELHTMFPFDDMIFQNKADELVLLIPMSLSDLIPKIEEFVLSHQEDNLVAGASSKNNRMIDASLLLQEADQAFHKAVREKEIFVAFDADEEKFLDLYS